MFKLLKKYSDIKTHLITLEVIYIMLSVLSLLLTVPYGTVITFLLFIGLLSLNFIFIEILTQILDIVFIQGELNGIKICREIVEGTLKFTAHQK